MPTDEHVLCLKRLVKYLAGKSRLVWRFFHQQDPQVLTTFVDTDFAGCHKTRRSTSGGAALRGGHLIKHWAQTQTTVALSSAEAELGGICRGASQGLGLVALAKDLNIDMKLDVRTDATAAIGVCRRRGLGKIRHLAVADLWVQEKVRLKEFTLTKVPGDVNPADLLTKHVDRRLLEKHLRTLNLFFDWGRSSNAPTIDQKSLPIPKDNLPGAPVD